MVSALRFITCLILAVCMVASSVDAAAITCNMVASSFTPCVNFLTKGGTVPPSCCASLKSLNSMANTTPDRQQACRCLQTLAKGFPGIESSSATSLPGKCGISIPFAISFSTNCNSVK